MAPLQSQNGIITPNGLFFVRDHAGSVMDIDPAQHRLMIHGLVARSGRACHCACCSNRRG
jgi:sulfane dehydrogenase subunit SoxC